MGDRKLSVAQESRNEEGPYWTITAERSSNGQPSVMFTIEHKPLTPGAYPEESMSIVVTDANEFLAPVIAWLSQRRHIVSATSSNPNVFEVDGAGGGRVNGPGVAKITTVWSDGVEETQTYTIA